MEGAVLAGKLAAEVVSDRAAGKEPKLDKAILQHIKDSAAAATPREPMGVKGQGAIAFGGGATLANTDKDYLAVTDPDQLIEA
jgi:15-cis-phytoene desaturase